MSDYRPEWCDVYAEGSTLFLRCNRCMKVYRITEPIGLQEFVQLGKDHAHDDSA